MDVPADYLIVSDLHLRGGFSNPTEGLYHFDEEFADFLRYYRVHRSSSRPWTLIIGGDFVEFLYITDLPDPNDRLLQGATFIDSEYRYGAGTEAQKSRWKLDTILRSSHPQLLLALARFVAEGNSIAVLRGNHDSEMFWPDVQAHFRRLIAEHHPADISYMHMKDAVAQRVQFPEWFVYVPNLLYVEHGCQYDPFCSFEYFLNPVVPECPTRIQMSIAELSIRYFTNQMKMMNAMAAENIKSVSEYIGWVVRGNVSMLPRTLRLYAGMVRRVLAKSGRSDPEAERAVRAEHERRLAATDERYGLPPGTAAAVDAMHATPVMRFPVAMARFLALDLIAGGVLLALIVAVVLIWYPARVGLLAVVGALGALSLIGYVGALRFRRVTEAAQLHRTAERIAALFKVPCVIFGHSHSAGRWPLPDHVTYINVGTWVPVSEDAYFVYCALDGEGAERQTRLWRWSKRQQRPERFEPP
ncbi:MAG: metallophosphoesterase [Candidatus Binatia bacterium]